MSRFPSTYLILSFQITQKDLKQTREIKIYLVLWPDLFYFLSTHILTTFSFLCYLYQKDLKLPRKTKIHLVLWPDPYYFLSTHNLTTFSLPLLSFFDSPHILSFQILQWNQNKPKEINIHLDYLPQCRLLFPFVFYQSNISYFWFLIFFFPSYFPYSSLSLHSSHLLFSDNSKKPKATEKIKKIISFSQATTKPFHLKIILSLTGCTRYFLSTYYFLRFKIISFHLSRVHDSISFCSTLYLLWGYTKDGNGTKRN